MHTDTMNGYFADTQEHPHDQSKTLELGDDVVGA